MEKLVCCLCSVNISYAITWHGMNTIIGQCFWFEQLFGCCGFCNSRERVQYGHWQVSSSLCGLYQNEKFYLVGVLLKSGKMDAVPGHIL